jgi:hypothetical protein
MQWDGIFQGNDMGLFDRLLGSGKKKEFAETLAQLLNSSDDVSSVFIDLETFTVNISDILGDTTVLLEDKFKAWADLPEDQQEAGMQDVAWLCLRTYAGVPLDFDLAQPNLYPFVRERVYFDVKPLYAEAVGDTVPDLPHALISDHLGVEVVYEHNGDVRTIGDWHLNHWGHTFEKMLAIACGNMKKYSTNRWTSPAPRVYVTPWKSPFDASLLLFGEALSDLRVIGDPVIMAPNQSTLIVTGSNDMHGLTTMAEFTEEIACGPRFLSTIPMTLADNQLVLYKMPRTHNLWKRYKVLHVENLMRDYTGQHEVLEPWLETTGQRVLVSEYTAYENGATGEVHSYCVWPNNSPPLLLPKTDRIYFMHDAAEQKVNVVANWDAVMDVLGDVVKQLDVAPPRYRVTGYPSKKQFEQFSGG